MGKPPTIQARQADGAWIVWNQYRNGYLKQPYNGRRYATQEQAERVARQLRRQRRASFYCLDCGVHTSRIREYYMVRPEVWRQANPASRGMLCIQDLEARLGRELRTEDFTNCGANDDWRKSRRLKDRMSKD